MSAANPESLRDLFERASALPPGEQEAFLEDACPDDPTVQAELQSLLAAARDAEGFFDSLADAVLSLSPWSDDEPSRGGAENSGPDPMIGRVVRQYRIEETLGRGGMGVVYRAHDTSLNRTVALKFLPRHMTGDEAATERFLVEAQAAAALDHPNVCNVYEIGEDEGGRRFIAMACYEGETLKRKLERGPLPIEEAWDYARQIAAGLGAAHAQEIIHRDIKPGNVIVTPDGTVKVLDFGLAKLTDVTLTGTGTTLGTVAYMSPEHAQGSAVDHRTDLWSLGVVLYEMLTGKRPFKGPSTAVVLHAIQREDPKPPSALRPEIPAELEAILGQLLAKDPEQRTESVETLLLESGQTRAPRGVFARPTGWARFRSPRRIAAVGAVIVVALAGWWFNRPPPAPPPGPIESVAVLPLHNLTGDPEQGYFAVAMHQALIIELGQIGGLTSVIPRQSVLPYTDLSIPEIAEQLDVDAVIEGALFKDGDGVTITATLVRAVDGEQMLSERFIGRLNEPFALHADIARAVADAIDVSFAPADVNPVAYALFTRGNDYMSRSLDADDVHAAIRLYEQAIAADPDFAPAHGMLAFALEYVDRIPPFESHADSAHRVVERALALDPDLPEAHLALSYSLVPPADAESRWQALELALQARPSPQLEAWIRMVMGVKLRGSGKWEEAIVQDERGVALDPSAPARWLNLLADYSMIRDWEGYEYASDRAIALGPDEPSALASRAYLLLLRDGDLDGAREQLVLAAQVGSPVDLLTGIYSWYYRDAIPFLNEDLRAEILGAPARQFKDAFHGPSYYLLVRAMLLGDEGRTTEARAHYDSISVMMEEYSAEGILLGQKRLRLAFAYAGLGRLQEAIEVAERAVEEYSGGDLFDWIHRRWLAEIYVMAGRPDEAIDLLESLLQEPAGVTVPFLRVHPAWDPLRDHPRFQALLETELVEGA